VAKPTGQDDAVIAELRDQIVESGDLECISSRRLVHRSFEPVIQDLLPAHNFVQARAYIKLGDDIDADVAERVNHPITTPANPIAAHQLIQQFDDATSIQVQKIHSHYDTLLESLAELWDDSLKHNYFKPLKRLRELRSESRKRPDDEELKERLSEQEDHEPELATVNFDTGSTIAFWVARPPN
jgi:NurA-like 5'-3' nuclease